MRAFRRNEFHLEFVFQVRERHERVEDVAAVLQLLHVVFLVHVVLVANFAHDFFQDVFERHKPGRSAVLVDNDGKLVARLAQFSKQVVYLLVVGHEHRRHHNLHDIERFVAMLGVPFQKIAI